MEFAESPVLYYNEPLTAEAEVLHGRDHPCTRLPLRSGVRTGTTSREISGRGRQRPAGASLLRRELRPVPTVLVALAASACLVALWYLASGPLGLVQPVLLPPPGEVWQAFVEMLSEPYLGETLLGHTLVSLRIVLGGWLLGGIVGVPLGVAIGWWRRARWVAFPLFQMLRPVPPLAWIPLAILWLGIGDVARIFVVFLAALIPWVMNSIAAVSSVDGLLIRAARTLGASDGLILRRVVIRTALPTIVGGARVALGNAWMTLIAAELLAASAGLGYVTLNSSKSLDTDVMVTAMLVIGVLGALFSYALRRAVRLVAPWAGDA